MAKPTKSGRHHARCSLPCLWGTYVLTTATHGSFTRFATWFLRRNPFYLISAVAMAAVIVHMGGVSALVWDRTPSDLFVVCLVAGWSALIGLHLFRTRAHILFRLLPILWLVAVSWCCDSDPTLVWTARAHAAATIVVLFLIGCKWRWTGYRMVAVGLIAAHIIHYGGRWLMSISNSTAFFVVICAFVLLATGSVISWYKQRMLEVIDRRAETVEDA